MDTETNTDRTDIIFDTRDEYRDAIATYEMDISPAIKFQDLLLALRRVEAYGHLDHAGATATRIHMLTARLNCMSERYGFLDNNPPN